MKYQVVNGKCDEQLMEHFNTAMRDTQRIGIFPCPGVIQEVLATHGVEVEIDVNGLDSASHQTIAVVRRKSDA